MSNGRLAIALACILLGCDDGSSEPAAHASSAAKVDARIRSDADDAGTPARDAGAALDARPSRDNDAALDASSGPLECALPGSTGAAADQIAGSAQSCDDRVATAVERVGAAVSANQACETDRDCVELSTSTGCNYTCGALISAACKEAVLAFIDQVDRELCASFSDTCDAPVLPPCPPPPPENEPKCVNGSCGF
jgi:hypothetical protein